MLSRGLAAASLGALLLGSMTPPARAAEHPKKSIVVRETRDAYALCRENRWVSTNLSLEEVKDLQRRFSGAFLWVRRGGKEYLIRDRAVLDEAQSLFAPLRALEPEQAALQERQAPLQSEEAALDREQVKLERELDGLEDDPERRDDAVARQSIETRQAELESRMRALEDSERELEAVERSLDRREENLERKAEDELWRVIDRAISGGLARSLARR